MIQSHAVVKGKAPIEVVSNLIKNITALTKGIDEFAHFVFLLVSSCQLCQEFLLLTSISSTSTVRLEKTSLMLADTSIKPVLEREVTQWDR